MGRKTSDTIHLRKLKKAMRKAQDAKRFEHTLGVEYTAAALAMRYEYDMTKAQAAGLLHDCAKCLTDEERLAICEKHHIAITEAERRSPFLLHAKVGAYLARKKYGIKDPDILNAICNHTTGRKNMSLLEKIVFVADYIEPGRKQAPNLEKIRKMAFVDLDEALLVILEDTLAYLKTTGSNIDPMTEETWRYYHKKKELAARPASAGE